MKKPVTPKGGKGAATKGKSAFGAKERAKFPPKKPGLKDPEPKRGASPLARKDKK